MQISPAELLRRDLWEADGGGKWWREARQGLLFLFAKEARLAGAMGLLLKMWGMSARWAFYLLILTHST